MDPALLPSGKQCLYQYDILAGTGQAEGVGTSELTLKEIICEPVGDKREFDCNIRL